MKDAYYFPHDSNAKDDPKCVLLIEQLGLEGYGIYWVLIEVLRDQPDYKYPTALIPALARRYNSTVENVKTVVENYSLFQVDDDNMFFSESLIKRMLPLEEKKEKARLAAQIRWDKYECNANALPKQSDSNANKIREEKKKENNNIYVPESKIDSENQPKTDFDKFNCWIKENTPHILKIKNQISEVQYNKLKEKYSHTQIENVLIALGNYKEAPKKYVSVYFTFLKWAEKEFQGSQEVSRTRKKLV